MSSVPAAIPAAAPVTPASVAATASSAGALQHRIAGSDLQFVEMTLAPGGAVVGEPGAMMYMDEGIAQQTVLGDGSDKNFLLRLWGSLKRMFTGESIFSVVYTNTGSAPRRLAFATPTIGKILAIDLAQVGGALICQKGSFLAAERGVEMGIAWTKKLRVGFFGGEGFIMQRLEGDGLCFVHAGGTVHPVDLQPGQTLRVDTGCLVALQPSVGYDIQFVGKIKTALFGGEGLFYAALTGPGRVWLQSLPLSRMADRIYKAAPAAGGKRVGEGSVLGGLGGILDGDR